MTATLCVSELATTVKGARDRVARDLEAAAAAFDTFGEPTAGSILATIAAKAEGLATGKGRLAAYDDALAYLTLAAIGISGPAARVIGLARKAERAAHEAASERAGMGLADPIRRGLVEAELAGKASAWRWVGREAQQMIEDAAEGFATLAD